MTQKMLFCPKFYNYPEMQAGSKPKKVKEAVFL
jgi:hypothetical protein